jgi:hypothetical protein
MNKLIILSIIGLLFLSAGYSALTDGLKAYWGMDETSGLIAYDNQYAFNGTIANNIILNEAGIFGKAFNFSKVSSEIKVGAGLKVTTGAVSYSFWYKGNPITSTSPEQVLFADEPATWGIAGLVYNGKFNPRVYTGTDFSCGGEKNLISTTSINNGSWFHLVFELNGSACLVYVNGNLEAISYSYPASRRTGTGNGTIGDGWDNNRGAMYFFDEFGVWNKSLTQTEVTQLFINKNPYYNPAITNYNVTLITDNTTWLIGSNSNWTVEFNSSNNILIRTFNRTGSEVTQNITLTSPQISTYATGVNITSGTNVSINCNNVSSSVCVLNFTNPFNNSVWKTITLNINDVKNISYANTTTFFKYNTSQALNFTIFLNDGSLTCNDYFNLSIPASNISNQLVKSCALTSITLNNSAVYEYEYYATNNRLGRLINNTGKLYTSNINISLNYSSQLYFNALNPINLNYSFFSGPALSVSYSINWNGTNYNSLSISPTTTNITGNAQNITLYYNISVTLNGSTLNYSEVFNQTLYRPIYDNCSSFTYKVLNFSYYDEISQSRINGSANIKIITNGLEYYLSQVNTSVFDVCLNYPLTDIADIEIEYYSTDYHTRYYYLFSTRLNTSTVEKKLYLISSTVGELMKWIISDNFNGKYPNYYIEILRNYWLEGYKTIGMSQLDFESIGQEFLQYDSGLYKTIVRDEEGNIVYTGSGGKFYNADNNPTTILIGSETINYYTKISSVSVSEGIYNNVTNMYSVIVSDASGYLSSITFKVVNYNLTQEVMICDTTAAFSVTHQPICNLSGYTGRFNIYIQGTFTDGSKYPLYTETLRLNAVQDFGKTNELLFTILIGVTAISLSLLSGHVSYGLMIFAVGLFTSYFIGFLKVTEVSIVGIVILFVSFAIWSWKSK